MSQVSDRPFPIVRKALLTNDSTSGESLTVMRFVLFLLRVIFLQCRTIVGQLQDKFQHLHCICRTNRYGVPSFKEYLSLMKNARTRQERSKLDNKRKYSVRLSAYASQLLDVAEAKTGKTPTELMEESVKYQIETVVRKDLKKQKQLKEFESSSVPPSTEESLLKKHSDDVRKPQ
jgi:hypothetical protein